MRILLAAALLAYPAALFLLAERAAPLAIACLFALIAAPRLLLAENLSRNTIALGLCALAVLCVVTGWAQNVVAVKLYPALMSAAAAGWCGYTLWAPPNAIERLLIIVNRRASNLPDRWRKHIPLADIQSPESGATKRSSPHSSASAPPSDVQRVYLRGLTAVWMTFFALNTAIAVYTATALSNGVWALYNGAISYVLVALLVGLELLYRPIYQRRYEQGNVSDTA